MFRIIFTVFILFNFVVSAQEYVQLLSNFNKYASAGYNDVWGYTSPDGREYALLGVGSGTSIIDVTNPKAPVESAFIPGPFSAWRDIKTHSHYAYVITEGTGAGRGLQIIDLSQLPQNAQLVKTVDDFFISAHNIFIDDGFAYVIGTNNGGGMHILDLADPVNPVRTNYYTGSGYIHDVYVWNDSVIACAGSSQSYHLIDVTDKSNPVKISESTPLPGIYAHSGWMTEDKKYFIAAEEFNVRDLTVWDISDRSSWDLKVSSWEMPTNSTIHNIFVKDNFAHISYYGDGYVVLDITNPEFPQLIAQYDLSSFESGYHGAWGCYPYLPSGNILMSSIEEGLFILKFTPPSHIPDPSPVISHQKMEGDYLSNNAVNLTASINDNSAVEEAFLYYRTINENDTSSWVQLSDPQGNNDALYKFLIPGQPHLTEIQYYIAASDDSNNVVTYPSGGSGLNPAGSVPPEELISYRVVIAGTPVIVDITPESGVILIPKTGTASMHMEARDTSGLPITYEWRRNSNRVNITGDTFNYNPSPLLPVPRTDTVVVTASNGYRSVSNKWMIQIEEVTGVKENSPLSYNLKQNYPNPFNPSTEIRFSIPETEFVNLTIYNLIGEKAAVLVNEVLPSGNYSKRFDASGFTSGIYIAKLTAGKYQQLIKMTLIK